MLKRALVMMFTLSFLAFAALVPATMTHATGQLQNTALPTALPTIVTTVIVPTVVVPGQTVVPGPTAQPVVPVTGIPTYSSLIILGLIVVVALAIIVGGLALISRQPRDITDVDTRDRR